MNEEKLMILRMLKEGKITEEEAAKLLDAIDGKDETNDNSKTNFKHKNNRDWQKEFEDKMNKLENNLNKFGEKFGEKMDKIGKDFSEGSDSFTDKIISSFNSLLDKDISNIIGRYEIKKETLKIEINDIDSPLLDIRSINGDISINPWSKDYIYVEAICHLKKNKISRENQIISLKKLDDNIILNPLFEFDIAVKLDISLPNRKYENMRINTTNGKIDILDLNSKEISTFTKNASINLYDVTCDNNINLTTKNGAVILNNTNSEKVDIFTKNDKVLISDGNIKNLNINTANSSIVLEKSKITNVFAQTSNEKIELNNIDSNTIKEVKLVTSNADIFINLEDFIKPYRIEANTTNSNINLSLPNLVYDYNDKNKNIKAHKESSTNEQQVVFDLNTTNGKINID